MSVDGFFTLGEITDPKGWAKTLIANEQAGEILSYYQRELAYSALGMPVPSAMTLRGERLSSSHEASSADRQ
jgi:hypothetical protein